MIRRNSKGQTLVLFALTLLLLTLMVTITLSVGMKAKEKMELETAADAAAYSQAVATARAYNGISVLNRALMSNMVAMAGVESLISWSSFYWGVVNEVKSGYNIPKAQYAAIVTACCIPASPCQAECVCATKAVADINQTQNQLSQEQNRLRQVFNSMDSAAGFEARGLQIGSVSDRQQEMFNRLLDDDLKSTTPKIAGAIVDAANNGGYWKDMKTTGAAVQENGQEQGGTCGGSGAACLRRDAAHKNHFIWATMGTRGHPFVTNRASGDTIIQAKIISLGVPPQEFVGFTADGSGYFADSRNHSASPAGNGAAWGDDHGNFTVEFLRQTAPCPPGIPSPRSPFAYVRSDDANQNNDQHRWSGGNDGGRRLDHTMGTCSLCPGMWPPHMDYNYATVKDPVNLWGQPKNYAVLERDYNIRMANPRKKDAWNLKFNFKFLKGGSGTEFDNEGLKLTNGTNISHAIALSAGLTYYHRVGDGSYKEPPNFLNPYWRATLVGADIDEGTGPIVSTLQAAGSQHSADVVNALKGVGYKAW